MKNQLLFSLIGLLFAISLQAQETGNFSINLEFNGEQRQVAFYVPDDYDEGNEYQLLIGLHGLGDNANNYRNALISSLSWNSFLPNTIFAIPDGGSDQNKDFYTPQGDEQFINEVLNYVKTNYLIDDSKIILQGFSLGGRSALKFGLDNHETFSSLVLNTPAMQGVFDIENDSSSSLIYNYENASEIPIAIIHGSEDFSYLKFDELLEKKIIENNGIVKRYLINNMPHTIPGETQMSPLFDYLENPYADGIDLEMVDLEIPFRSCGIFPRDYSFLIRNTGITKSGSVYVDVNIKKEGVISKNGGSYQIELDSYESELITLSIPSQSINNSGEYEIEIIAKSTSPENDINSNNDTIRKSLKFYNEGIPESVTMGFEGGEDYEDDWLIEASDHFINWNIDDEVGKNSNSSIAMFNTLLLFNNLGLSEDFHSPIINMGELETKAIQFDYAFNYHRYTPPYTQGELNLTDTLRVFASTDCGENYELIFEKYGEELATANEPIVNALNVQNAIFVPNQDQWRTETIDLSDYSEDEITIKFSLISGLGGTTYLDNIKIGDIITNVDFVQEKSFSIYPNPVKDILKIEDTAAGNASYKITDIKSRVLLETKAGHSVDELDISSFSSGTYFLTKISNEKQETVKFIKE